MGSGFAFAYPAFGWRTERRSRVTRSTKEWIIFDIPQPSTVFRRLLAVELVLYHYEATIMTNDGLDRKDGEIVHGRQNDSVDPSLELRGQRVKLFNANITV